MKNLLVGNGINIQFDNKNYTTQQIVLRALKNCDRDDFPNHIIVDEAYLMKNYFAKLFDVARDVIMGEYDAIANCSAERKSIESFKEQYSYRYETLKITDIGFEDYYLLHDLLCHKINMENPTQFYVREALKVLYLYSIYNDGKLNQIFKLYPKRFIEYLDSFNNIFSTNYDSNIESVVGKHIFHIHGQFDKKADVYDPSSLRNKLPDAPINDVEIDDDYFYLYSNAISTHCGDYKSLIINQNMSANSAISKMAIGYLESTDTKAEIDSWTEDENRLTSNMGYLIQLKAKHPEFEFDNNYHFDELEKISGTLEILGLSPWNDFHIFEAINNSKIEKCIFYYYKIEEGKRIKDLLNQLDKLGKVELRPVEKFWRDMYED